MTDMFSIFTEVDEQKIGIAVEPIPGKMGFLSTTARIRYISAGESTTRINHPLDSTLLSEVNRPSII